jgi:hypothetical protein
VANSQTAVVDTASWDPVHTYTDPAGRLLPYDYI